MQSRRYLVCRLDLIRPGNPVRGSDYFPMEVIMDYEPGTYIDAEHIVRKAFSRIKENYIGMHEYIVIPLESAKVVTFTPTPPPPPPIEVKVVDYSMYHCGRNDSL